MKTYDTLIIGSGGGTKIAQALNKLGRPTALIEKDKSGGTCLNRGCIPSKMLIYPSGLAEKLRRFQPMGISGSIEAVDFESVTTAINAYTDETSESITDHYEDAEHVDYYRGEARFTGDKTIQVGDHKLTAERIIIATGSRPRIPDWPGLAGTPYMTSEDALRNRELPARLLVIGGGYIAAELGSAYAGYGSQVDLIVRSRMLKREDEEIRQEFLKDFGRHVQVHEETNVNSVRYHNGTFTLELAGPESAPATLEGDALLVATGVVPNADTLGLEHTGIRRTQAGFIEINDHLETCVPGIFAIGDVAGNFLFRHSVNFEGEYWVRSQLLADAPFPIDYPPMPGAVFTHPEIASVGKTEEEAKNEGRLIVIGQAEYTSCAMAKARGLDHGRVKLLFNRKDQALIGAHIVGEDASTLIQELILACTHHLTAKDLYQQIYIHPAFPEVIRNAVRDVLHQLDEQYTLLF